jgi:alkylation response protein AidB-like acyl-CoA dehydrogenase
MIDLEFDEQQQLLQQTAREFFARQCPLARVRSLEESDAGYAPDLWEAMAALHWVGLSYPEELGGADGGILDQYVIYVEMGRSLAPTPHLASSVISGETLLAAGSETQKKRLIPEMARGDLIVAPALTEPDGAYGADAIQLAATEDAGGGYRLDGVKVLVPYAHVAGQLLVAARTGASPDGVTLFLVEPGTAGVAIEKLDNIAGHPLFAVTFDGVAVHSEAIVGPLGGGWAELAPVLDRATVLQCAEIVGAGEAVLDIAVRYAQEREQFGQPIGRFQAVQYLCSDIAIDLHLTSLLGRQAAWLVDTGRPHARELALAKAQASEAAQHMVRQAHEVLAGHGFMVETDLQLYTRRAKHWEFNLGDVHYQLDAAVAAL